MRLLARREHSRRELGGKLAARGFPANEIAAALDELEGRGLLSDARFAEMFVRHRAEQGYGPLRIRMELEQRGVEAGLYLDAWADEWRTIGRRAYERHFGASVPVAMKDRAQRIRYLEGRGFPHDVIRAVMNGNDDST